MPAPAVKKHGSSGCRRLLWPVCLLCLCLLGCQVIESVPSTIPTDATSLPSTAPTDAPVTHATVPTVSIPAEREPLLEPPIAGDVPEDFFADCAFVGDSVSYGLMLECMRTGELKGALFLATKNMGQANSLFGGFQHSYQGQSMSTEDALAASGAKKVFIMLGMNDLSSTAPDQCVAYWEILITRILEKCPDMEIYIQSGTPVYTGSEHDALTNANIDTYNQLLEAMAKAKGFHYVDIASYLKDQTGGIAHRYCSDDYVHLTSEGAQVWIAVLKAYIVQRGGN